MTLKSNDYAIIVNGHPILPGDLCGHGPLDLLTFAANFQFSAQDGGLDCFCNFIAERGKTPRICYAPSRNGWERE